MAFANPRQPLQFIWYPSSGNHVLYTLLSRFTTWLFGLNKLTLRIPAIVAAAIYITSALDISVLLTKSKVLRLSLFVAHVYNPFVMDYLVAARGYSLALAFLLAALTSLCVVIRRSAPTHFGLCAMASACVGLSFCASFPFALADAAVLGIFWIWAVRKPFRWLDIAKISAAVSLPALAVISSICGWTLANWPRGQLYSGTNSIAESLIEIRLSCFDKLNPLLASSFLVNVLSFLPAILPCTGTAVALLLIARLIVRRHNGDAITSTALFLFRVLTLTVVMHWFAFRAFGLLLPLRRTGVFVAPLTVLALGAALAADYEATVFRLLKSVGIATLLLADVYFLGCLRLDYFREWRYNADAKHLYWIITDLNRRCGVKDFTTEWRYVAALNFYRLYFANDMLHEFTRGDRSHLARRPTFFSIPAPSHSCGNNVYSCSITTMIRRPL